MNLQPETAFAQRHLEALHRVGKLVSASLDLEATLEAIVEAAHQLTHAESTAILLLDQEELVIRVGHGMAAGAVGERVRVNAGVVGRAFREGRPVLEPDMLMEPGRARPPSSARSPRHQSAGLAVDRGGRAPRPRRCPRGDRRLQLDLRPAPRDRPPGRRSQDQDG